MLLTKIQKRCQIRIPEEMQEKYSLEEGEYIALVPVKAGILLKPIATGSVEIKSPEAKFKLKEALEDYKAGRIKKFEDVESLIKDLHELNKNKKI
jgi:bifunctional DNA-binding transcriptional regulator/antitoxin component of YhaV-PrlF toxin-antitoxin module